MEGFRASPPDPHPEPSRKSAVAGDYSERVPLNDEEVIIACTRGDVGCALSAFSPAIQRRVIDVLADRTGSLHSPGRTDPRENDMRNLIFVAAAFTAIGTFPAAAAGCGMMQQAAAGSTAASTSAAGGMMCGAASGAASQSTSGEPGQSTPAAGGCPCCAKMASMEMPETGDSDAMPGMDMPAETPTNDQ